MMQAKSTKTSATENARQDIHFNAQHSPMGAFLSFTCGNYGTQGGFGLEIGRPGDQDVYVGVKDGRRSEPGEVRCLPFYDAPRQPDDAAANFLVGQAAKARPKFWITPFQREQMGRHYGWATDRFDAPGVTFSLFTPFASIPNPSTAPSSALRDALLPAIMAELTIDNTDGQQIKTGIFGLKFPQRGVTQLPPRDGTIGFAHKNGCGAMAELRHGDRPASAGESPDLICSFSLERALDASVPHWLGGCPAFTFEVPPGQTRTLRIALGCYRGGLATSGIEASYLYTRYFCDLNDVLVQTLNSADDNIRQAEVLDEELRQSGLSADQQFLLAHATRSYYGSTQLLQAAGEPLWVVNEGEYCMMNTLDLSIDQVFWELRHNPWVVKNLLERFVSHYSYVDQVKDRAGMQRPGGLSFAHDMGAYNCFSPRGRSSYELPNLAGCFSFMTAEQLCNWSLLAATYFAHTGDLEWARQNAPVIKACVDSLIARSGGDGMIQFDSAECGTGAEITTYDSLDHSLAQTRNNAYIGVKCWASYAGLNVIATALGDADTAARAAIQAVRLAETLVNHAGADGVLPAIFEADSPGHHSRILPAAEGLVYLIDWREAEYGAWAAQQWLTTPESERLITVLKRHTRALLLDPERRNFFEDGGIRLSSTSDNSWMSKIAIIQHVARKLFGAADDAAMIKLMNEADAAHVSWQTIGSAYWACCDQIVNGIAKASRYYPRIISACLWLDR